MTTAQPPATSCPNCHAALQRGARQCSVCKLEVSKMSAFANAKLAAHRKGFGATQVESEAAIPFYRKPLRPAVIFPVLILLLVLVYFTRKTSPPSWTTLPSTQTEVAKQLLSHISTGIDAGYDGAYRLVASSAKNPKDSDELGKYRQLYHVLNNYLSAEFGSDWINLLTLEPDKGNADLIAAHIGPETLHLRAEEQTPADKLKGVGDTNHHYAIEGIDEFDIADAAALQKAAGIMGVLKGYAGQGAVNNVQTIISSMGGGQRRETAMQTKLRILPNLRDPRNVTRRAVLQSWPVRKDAVIKNRLKQMVDDGRYPGDVKQTAQDVLNENVAEEELIAAGVNETW